MTTKLKPRTAEQIAADNAAFAALPPEQKRVQIAQDVLAQLAAKRIIANNGTWIADEVGDDDAIKRKDLTGEEVVRDVLVPQCSACALGALFICAVERADALKVSDLADWKEIQAPRIQMHDLTGYLGKFFERDQIQLIEGAFESGSGAYGIDPDDCSDDERAALDFFGDEYEYQDTPSTDKMALIMLNIIRNKGEFYPEECIPQEDYDTVNKLKLAMITAVGPLAEGV